MLRQKNKHTKEDVETKEEEKEEGEQFSLLYSSMSLSMVRSWVNLGKDLDLSCFTMQSFRQKLFIALQYCKTGVDSAFCPVVLLVCILLTYCIMWNTIKYCYSWHALGCYILFSCMKGKERKPGFKVIYKNTAKWYSTPGTEGVCALIKGSTVEAWWCWVLDSQSLISRPVHVP